MTKSLRFVGVPPIWKTRILTTFLQVYKQIAQIPAGTARKDARRLTKKEKAKLPRVTAYCTAQLVFFTALPDSSTHVAT
jgi:uncharacterized Rmd1/YagE family protein